MGTGTKVWSKYLFKRYRKQILGADIETFRWKAGEGDGT